MTPEYEKELEQIKKRKCIRMIFSFLWLAFACFIFGHYLHDMPVGLAIGIAIMSAVSLHADLTTL